ncbi:MAG: MarR family transcriptional regulator [Syntrophomonadaceae bacterium]|nr:MarR family transcriptional regulator [Syntrophomonadaceae bacterium]MDH7498071.1 MarR family transcriptional regulator [Syntrophomonadaceae bacterium]
MERWQNLLATLSELARAVRCCHQEDLCGEGITFVQFTIMNFIQGRGTVPLAELHRALEVDKSTTTRLLAPLVRRGLVVKRKSPADARTLEVCLSEEGQRRWERSWACLQGFLQAVDTRLPADRREQVYEDVRLYVQALRAACGACRCGACE